MLALNHASLAVTCALGYSLYTNTPIFLPLLIFVVFAGVMPDIDHPNSELGKYFKPVGKILPHRGVTHSFLGTAIFLGLAYFLSSTDKVVMTVLVLAALFGWNLTKKIFKTHITSWDEKTRNLISSKQTEFIFAAFSYIINTALIIVLILIWRQEYGRQIFFLLGLGYLAHLIGDFVTIEGIPLFWPIKQKFGLRLFRTGGAIESLIGFILFFTNLYLIYKFCLQFNVISPEYWSKLFLN
jgi:membrane-bound metal-dependent hydrolase YbcI (DUF457 family)